VSLDWAMTQNSLGIAQALLSERLGLMHYSCFAGLPMDQIITYAIRPTRWNIAATLSVGPEGTRVI
jgi:hypothetical protein